MWGPAQWEASAAARAARSANDKGLTRLGRKTMASVAAHQSGVSRVPANYSGLTALGRATLAGKGATSNFTNSMNYKGAAYGASTYGVPLAARTVMS